MNHRTLRPLAALALLLATSASAPAQPAEAPAPAATSESAEAPPAPIAIPAAEVVDRAQQDAERIDRLRARAKPDPAVDEIERQAIASAKEVARLVATSRERLSEGVSRADLDRTTFEFERLRERLGGWSETLAKRAESFGADLASIAERRVVWSATREKAVADAQPGAVLARIDKTLVGLDRAERAAQARRNEVLTLREDVARQQSSVDRLLEQMRSIRAQRRKSLFALDRPPLWEAIAGPEPVEGTLLERLRTARANDLADLDAFARERSMELVLLGLLSIGVILAGVAMRDPVRRLAEQDESLVAPARILERGVSAGLVIAGMIAVPLFPTAPPAFEGIRQIVLLVAMLRLLLPVIDPGLRPILYGLTAWYAVDRLRDRLLPDPFAQRLAVLAMAMVAVAGFLWLLRPARISKLGQLSRHGAWLRLIGFGMRLGLVLTAASIVANVIGNTTFAEIAVEGTLASALLAFFFFAGFRVLEAVWALLLRTPMARTLRMVRNHGPLLQRRGRSLIRAALVLWWLDASLEGFDAVDPTYAAIVRILDARWGLGELSLSLGGILALALMVYASILVSRFVRFALEEELLERASLPRGVPFAISTLARYAILLIGFGMAVLAAGFEMSRLALLVGALGVGIGIGLQDIVNNVVSGLILLFERPVQAGDVVEVGGTFGEVRRIGIRSSTVRGFDGAELVIPNSKLVSETFVNWTLSDRQRRIEVPVGVSYGSDPDRVLEVLVGVVTARPELLQQPPPSVIFMGFGESSLDFQVRAWTPDADNALTLRSQIILDLHRALREAGIEIPFPQRDLHLRSVDPAAGRALASEAAAEPPAALRRPG